MDTTIENKNKKKKPLDDLKIAIQNLEKFAHFNEGESIPNVQNIKVEGNTLVSKDLSSLEKTIDLFKSFFSKSREKRQKKSLAVKKTLIESIESLKTHYRIIHMLKRGNEAEQELAKRALKSIQRYNSLIGKVELAPQRIKERAVHYMYQKSGFILGEDFKKNKIEIPHESSLPFNRSICNLSEEDIFHTTSQKISSLLKHVQISTYIPTKQEQEMFLMKTICLGKNTLPAALSKSMRDLICEMPIHVTSSNFKGIENTGEGIVKFEQSLSTLPGEIIKAQGSFRRDARSPVPSVPIADSFQIFTDVIQTGYPHPSQTTGWSLSNSLIPDCPHRTDQMALFEPLFEIKKTQALELLPAGALNEKAKHLLHLKKTVFSKHSSFFLKKHLLGMEKFIFACEEYNSSLTQEALDSLAPFFELLEKQPEAFDLLSHTHHLINTLFIDRPFEIFHKRWLEDKDPDIFHEDPKCRYQACLNILEEVMANSMREISKQMEVLLITSESTSRENIILLDYVLKMGRLIGLGARALILQQLSEKIIFPPPLLNDFEQKIQAFVFKQLLSFQEELEFPLGSPDQLETLIKETMTTNLEEQIALWQADTCDAVQDISIDITHELEFYYNSRYYSRL